MTSGQLHKRGISAASFILAATFFYIASTMLVNPLITGFSAELGTGEALAGALAALMSVCSLVMRPVGGNLCDRFNLRALATLGAGLMAVAGLGYAVVTTPLALAVLRVVNGIGYSLCSVCMSTWFASMLPEGQIGSGMGTFGMMNALAMAVGPACGVQLSRALGYRPALACAGLFALASVALIRAAGAQSSDTPDEGKQTVPAPKAKHGFQILDVRALPYALIITCFTIPYTATQSYIVTYAAAHNAGAYVTYFFPVYAIILLALRYGLKKQFDIVGFGKFLAVASLSAVAACIALWTLGGSLGLFAAALFLAASYGLMVSVCQAAAVRACGPEHRGLANGTYFIGFDLGLTLGPLIAGIIIEAFGMSVLYPAMMACVPFAIAIWFIALRNGASKTSQI